LSFDKRDQSTTEVKNKIALECRSPAAVSFLKFVSENNTLLKNHQKTRHCMLSAFFVLSVEKRRKVDRTESKFKRKKEKMRVFMNKN
jgi:menaquinone-dependent protoporphyrinogen IX oxidase